MKMLARILAVWVVAVSTMLARADEPATTTAPAPGPAAAPTQIGVIKATRINVRTEPSLKGEIVGQFTKGETVTIFEAKQTPGASPTDKPEWLRVALPSWVLVYVYKDFIKDDTANALKLNVRSGPGLNHAIVGHLKVGDKVKIVETKDRWLAIKPPATTYGWISSQYVDVVHSEPVAAQPAMPEPAIQETVVIDQKPEPEIALASTSRAEDSIVRDGMIRGGTLKKADTDAPEGATHQLYVAGKTSSEFTICYVKWANPDIKPPRFESKLVKIRGREIWTRGKRFPLIEVAEIEKIW